MPAVKLSAARLRQMLHADATTPAAASLPAVAAQRRKRSRNGTRKKLPGNQLPTKQLGRVSKKNSRPSQPPPAAAAAAPSSDDPLLAAKFRYLNEQLYTMTSAEAFAMFKKDREAFEIYHAGYEAQRLKWDSDHLKPIVRICKKLSAGKVIVDFGCGSARLAELLSSKHTVHSFDLVALSPRVVACDMANCPLDDAVADVAVFSLSLMNSNPVDFLCEASRVLKMGGLLLVTEIASRLERPQRFANLVAKLGYQSCRIRQDKYLVYFSFVKVHKLPADKARPEIILKPCLYKKR